MPIHPQSETCPPDRQSFRTITFWSQSIVKKLHLWVMVTAALNKLKDISVTMKTFPWNRSEHQIIEHSEKNPPISGWSKSIHQAEFMELSWKILTIIITCFKNKMLAFLGQQINHGKSSLGVSLSLCQLLPSQIATNAADGFAWKNENDDLSCSLLNFGGRFSTSYLLFEYLLMELYNGVNMYWLIRTFFGRFLFLQ